MERHGTSVRLLLAMLLLLATELAAFGCCGGHRIPRADVAAWRRHGRVAAAAATTTVAAASATAPAAAARDAEAVLGESKRLVPQGSNPLHN
ncbi:hypothetical protein PAHAL_7G231300 [Panicum hallii]|uniref:Uncharacterized protein n=1 Tax=Panicum hallii TaxID=206008 RepID=A0A2S3I8U1_9POAL|nr:uncharacterized protein LOC112898974 [Panicum hallii]PAN39258.1 hypothetical protein PAHAL_7G231300 [Panicum hallii]